jgi:hypothetical protein
MIRERDARYLHRKIYTVKSVVQREEKSLAGFADLEKKTVLDISSETKQLLIFDWGGGSTCSASFDRCSPSVDVWVCLADM